MKCEHGTWHSGKNPFHYQIVVDEWYRDSYLCGGPMGGAESHGGCFLYITSPQHSLLQSLSAFDD